MGKALFCLLGLAASVPAAAIAQTAEKPSVVGTWTAEDAQTRATVVLNRDGVRRRHVDFADKQGKTVIAPTYEEVQGFSRGLAAVKLEDAGSPAGLFLPKAAEVPAP